MHGRKGLRRGFGEDEHDQRQQQGAERYRGLAAHLERDDGDQRCRGEVHQVVAEQDQADQPVGSLQQRFREPRTPVSLPGLVAKLVAVEAHESRFRAGEEGGKK